MVQGLHCFYSGGGDGGRGGGGIRYVVTDTPVFTLFYVPVIYINTFAASYLNTQGR